MYGKIWQEWQEWQESLVINPKFLDIFLNFGVNAFQKLKEPYTKLCAVYGKLCADWPSLELRAWLAMLPIISSLAQVKNPNKIFSNFSLSLTL